MPDAVVAWGLENARTCLCLGCPVQASSSCSATKMAPLRGATESTTPASMPPTPEDLAALYCSSGKAVCHDLDADQACVCPTCDVYRAAGLDSLKYCLRGSAAEIG